MKKTFIITVILIMLTAWGVKGFSSDYQNFLYKTGINWGTVMMIGSFYFLRIHIYLLFVWFFYRLFSDGTKQAISFTKQSVTILHWKSTSRGIMMAHKWGLLTEVVIMILGLLLMIFCTIVSMSMSIIKGLMLPVAIFLLMAMWTRFKAFVNS
ncbi:hypothetical protein [Laceyella putida]|uniref:Uncharacterized protein n=1 Tax=Laceyella putida TaxID=110101 RepID=A0ABW2RKF2_9BACL